MSGTLSSAHWVEWTALAVPVTLPSHSKAGPVPTVLTRHCGQSRVRPGCPTLLTSRPVRGRGVWSCCSRLHPSTLISP